MTIKKSEIFLIEENYAYVMVDGALTNVKILKNTFKLYQNKEGGYHEFGEYAIVTAQLPDGTIREFDLEEVHFYKSENDFKVYSNTFNTTNVKDAVSKSGLAINKDNENLCHFSPNAFVFDKEKGCPVEKHLTDNFELYYIPGKGFTNSFVGEKGIYTTYQDCLWSEDYVVKERDGKVREVKSVRKRAVLTDEQKTLVANISKAIKAAEDAGVYVYFDCEDDHIRSFNIKELDFEFECGGYSEQNALTLDDIANLGEKIYNLRRFYEDDVVICTAK